MMAGEVADFLLPEEAWAGNRAAGVIVFDGRLGWDPGPFSRQGIPTLRVALSNEAPGYPVRVELTIGPSPHYLRLSPADFSSSALTIAGWLGENVKVEVTLEQRHMLEVVLRAVRTVQESDESSKWDPNMVAQTQAGAPVQGDAV